MEGEKKQEAKRSVKTNRFYLDIMHPLYNKLGCIHIKKKRITIYSYKKNKNNVVTVVNTV